MSAEDPFQPEKIDEEVDLRPSDEIAIMPDPEDDVDDIELLVVNEGSPRREWLAFDADVSLNVEDYQ